MSQFVRSGGLTITAGAEVIAVADVVALARAAGAAIMNIYASETEVR